MSTYMSRDLIGSDRKKGAAFPTSWRNYWEVPALASQMHEHRVQSQYYVKELEKAISLDSKMRVLDFGCGFGFVAEELAGKVSEVLLWDASRNMRSRAQQLNASCGNVRLVDLSNEQAIASSPSVDLILVNSVVQYMNREELSIWLTRWRAMLAPNGRVVLSDLLPPIAPSFFFELYEAFVFNVKRGLLLHLLSPATFAGLKRYSKTSQVAEPLLRLGEEALAELAKTAGLSAEIMSKNLTYFSRRLTAVFTKRT